MITVLNLFLFIISAYCPFILKHTTVIKMTKILEEHFNKLRGRNMQHMNKNNLTI